jgi:hypothetical protein
MISEERLAELAEILREDYGRDLSPAEVAEIGRRLVGFFELLAEFDRRDQAAVEGAGESGDEGGETEKEAAVSVGPRSFSGP